MFKTVNGGKFPERGSKYSACIDLFSNEDVTIGAGETKLVGLGVVIDHEDLRSHLQSADERITWDDHLVNHFKSKHYLQLMLRSSLGKKGLIIPNGVGIIDIDYKDEIKMIIHNPVNNNTLLEIYQEYAHCNHEGIEIKKGDKIAQITLLEHKGYLFDIHSEEERTGGFGSSGSR
jgi:dUTP pyrophosphatase